MSPLQTLLQTLLQAFRAFSQAGRRLADLHLHYESTDKSSNITNDTNHYA